RLRRQVPRNRGPPQSPVHPDRRRQGSGCGVAAPPPGLAQWPARRTHGRRTRRHRPCRPAPPAHRRLLNRNIMHPVEALLLPVGWLLRNRRPDEAASIANAPELATGHRITLTSPAFGDGQVVPAEYCGQFIGDDISPALTWSALPEGTKGLVFVLED